LIFLEKIKLSLSLAVLLKDDLSHDKKAFGDLFLNVPLKRKTVIRNSTGHFLLIDLPEVHQIIIGGGEYYNQSTLTIDYKQGMLYADNNQVDPGNPVANIALSPKSNYPLPEGMTILKGKLIDTEKKPISGAFIRVANMTQSAISEDNVRYFIQFPALDSNQTVTLDISKDGYKSAEQTATLKKGSTAHADTTILTRL
jgi:hypothetical protein